MRERLQDNCVSKEHCPSLVAVTAYSEGADFGCAWGPRIPLMHTASIVGMELGLCFRIF